MVYRIKKSQSQIITIVLIILIAFVIILIVWRVFDMLIKAKTGEIGIEQFSLTLSSKDYNISGNFIKIPVSVSAGEGNLSAIKIIFYDDKGNVKIYINDTFVPKQLETVVYSIDLAALGITGNLTKYEVYPVFDVKGKKILGIPVKVEISGGISVPIISWCGLGKVNCSGICYTGNCCADSDCAGGQKCNLTTHTCYTPACDPQNCTYHYSQGKCGSSLANGTCLGTLSCLSCPNGRACNGTDCVSLELLSYHHVCGGSDYCAIESDDCDNAAHSSISVTATGTVYSPGIDVFVDGDEAYDACNNMKIILESPTGTKATLCDWNIRQPCCERTYPGAWVDTWYNDLSNFNGENISGIWTLILCKADYGDIYGLNLRSWTLNITKTP